ncbi:MAG: DUF1638 domain-containing protein [Treponemataceae bacterium]
MGEKVLLIACGVFQKEYERLPTDLRERLEAHFLDSMLHMRPADLDEAIREWLPQPPRRAILLFGDCSPHMREFAAHPGTVRVSGINCIEIHLGSERYKTLRHRGSFFMMPEWIDRWEEVFKKELGLGKTDLARDFMRDSATELVYLDTGGESVPQATLAAASNYLGLQFRIEKSRSDRLETALRAALTELNDVK